MTSQPQDAPSQPVGQIIGEIADDLSRLFRQEVELAKAEVRQEAGKAGRAAGMFTGAGVAALLVAVMLSLTLMYLLAEVMHIALAALIVGVVWAVVAAVLVTAARRRLRTVRAMPQTTETLKENAQWLQNPTR